MDFSTKNVKNAVKKHKIYYNMQTLVIKIIILMSRFLP